MLKRIEAARTTPAHVFPLSLKPWPGAPILTYKPTKRPKDIYLDGALQLVFIKCMERKKCILYLSKARGDSVTTSREVQMYAYAFCQDWVTTGQAQLPAITNRRLCKHEWCSLHL